MGSVSPKESQAAVADAVRRSPGRLRKASAATLLVVLGAAALTPVAVAVAGGGVLATAIGGMAGGIGSAQVTALIQHCAARIKGRSPEPDDVRQELEAALAAHLARADADADRLQAELVGILDHIGGFETALASAADDIHDHLQSAFAQLERHSGEILDALAELEAGQSHLNHKLDELSAQQINVQRQLRTALSERTAPITPAPTDFSSAPARFEVAPTEPRQERWAPGGKITVAGATYLLYDRQVQERLTPDASAQLHSALARRIDRSRGPRFVWLRQIRRLGTGRAARAAEDGLRQERQLLDDLAPHRALPAVAQFDTAGTTLTSALAWPTRQRGAVPCEGLDTFTADDGRPPSPWMLQELFTGLSGLCDALAGLHRSGISHRDLTQEGILITGTGRLALRDLGAAGRPPLAGETESPYAAPEQRRNSGTRPGPATDVYQLAAMTYHLLTGHPPAGPLPLPLHTQAPNTPAALGRRLDQALTEPIPERPSAAALAGAFRAAAESR